MKEQKAKIQTEARKSREEARETRSDKR